MLGSGMDEYESAMRGLEAAHPTHFRGWVGFSVPVAHRIVAGPAPLSSYHAQHSMHPLAKCCIAAAIGSREYLRLSLFHDYTCHRS